MRFLILLIPFAFFTACWDSEDFDGDITLDGNETPNTDDGENPTAPPSDDQAAWDNIRWFTARGPAGRVGQPQVMTLTADATGGNGQVRFSWDQIPWNEDLFLGHFFVWNEGAQRWEGGKFEWIRRGGQPIKLLQNIRSGYNGLRAPPSGARVAFAWTNAANTERSNLAETRWP